VIRVCDNRGNAILRNRVIHFRCPQAHEWDAESVAAHCPACGAAAETHTLPVPEPLTGEARAHLERVINRFEDEWQNGAGPSLEAYLAELPHHRDALLAELAQVDLELRLKKGEAARVEAYLARYPRLAEIPDALLELLAREFSLRGREGNTPDIDEYCAISSRATSVSMLRASRTCSISGWRRPPASPTSMNTVAR
jgi:hypothetical protein